MKTLVIVAHPSIEDSRINKRWVQELTKHSDTITVHQLYSTYPDWTFQIEHEQKLVMEHERVIFQFPFYWYSSPPLLKKWLDDVFTHGWAYGSLGDKLQGKELGLAISTGVLQADYQAGGANHFTLSELTRPFQATCIYTGMKFMPIFAIYGAEHHLTDEEVEQSAIDYVTHILKS
ncbi:NAD(P)H-dependent oxidoreductase [Brevibacillus laterosporus]|uniref:NAD(P)H-dependent oxidoreductase n=1 Tax=Brevibacillus laterosporus TaxID=1465 RepID=A0AAP3DG17_BRELA|nr:NAD(P)H-dependent oxidoreductase [Brevibacillus laterosporus]MCR8980036.1 NAD(P)H-dependent oxidoreductase [Brevibacillus laterosporus]MCZ0807191.1 NAD(P)H-dependent oxidoreductase [Brevibacillus laterosporus]MCZ0825412.1 NAD(P)H-dependent oxidoreductase [Brevibacillus laterosporus]MCZ0849169.1 NAD(P)H-dependent oxidoreductase [Brevibacillus laterosporus]